jgi:hypothetical protein
VTPYIPHCAVPLLFESGNQDFPYGMCGTGFLARSSDRYFFITAKHILMRGDYERLRVVNGFGSLDGELLEFGQFGHPMLDEAETDTDWGDFAVFSVVPREFGCSGETNLLEPAYLFDLDTRHLLIDGMTLTVQGFPENAPNSCIDFENKRVLAQSFTCDARFIRLTDCQACYELQFAQSCPITDFNFMSGSPVFAKFQPPEGGQVWWVPVGMMLRAGGSHRLGRFLSIEVVKKLLAVYADPQEREKLPK